VEEVAEGFFGRYVVGSGLGGENYVEESETQPANLRPLFISLELRLFGNG